MKTAAIVATISGFQVEISDFCIQATGGGVVYPYNIIYAPIKHFLLQTRATIQEVN